MEKKRVVKVLLIFIVFILTACSGSSEWEGTYGGTSTNGNKVEIIVNEDGSIIYNENGEKIEGQWTENENSLNLDFNGEVSSKSEPLILTISSDKQIITLDSMNSSWNADFYQRR